MAHTLHQGLSVPIIGSFCLFRSRPAMGASPGRPEMPTPSVDGLIAGMFERLWTCLCSVDRGCEGLVGSDTDMRMIRCFRIRPGSSLLTPSHCTLP